MGGFATKESLFNSVIIGLTNIVFTFGGLMLIDRLGRRQLLIIGSIGYIIGLSGVSSAFYFDLIPQLIAFFIFFIYSRPCYWSRYCYMGFYFRNFPNRIRAMGQSFGSGIHWVFAALITLFGPSVIEIYNTNPWPILLFLHS